jgi:hypothetical protein
VTCCRRSASASATARLATRDGLRALAAIWLRAEWARELVIAAADRRPEGDWRVLRELCSEAGVRLTLVVERRVSSDHVAELGDAVLELTLDELVAELPLALPPDEWGLFDESGSPDDRRGYPPVPDVDFAFFPSACADLLPEHDAFWVMRAFERARAATMLWLELRRGIEDRHGPSPRHAHAFLDTLVAPCVTVDGAITVLRGAQAAFPVHGPCSRSTRTRSRLTTKPVPARPRPTRPRRSCAATQSHTSPLSARSRPQPERTPS